MRVYELAKELGKQAKVLLEELRALGFDVKAPMSGLSEDEVEQIRRAYAGLGDELSVVGGQPSGSAPDEATVEPESEVATSAPHMVLPFGGFVLVRKATVSAGGVVMKKGQRVPAATFRALPRRVWTFFDEVR